MSAPSRVRRFRTGFRARWDRVEMATVSDDERTALQTDIDAAIDDLKHRKITTQKRADYARPSEPGGLSLSMSRK